MINSLSVLLRASLIVLFLFSSLGHAENKARQALSIRETIDTYNDMDVKPTLNNCRVHKTENRYYLPEVCNIFVFTAYILENECVSGSKNKIAISSNAAFVNFEVNKSTCEYLTVNRNVASEVSIKDAADKRIKDAADKRIKDAADKRVKDAADMRIKDAADERVKVAADKRVKVAADKRVKDAEDKRIKDAADMRIKDAADERVKVAADKRVKDAADKRTESALKPVKLKPSRTAKILKQKKYFLQVYMGKQYPKVTYTCDDFRFNTRVVGDSVYILSDEYLYSDALKNRVKMQRCGIDTWIRPVDRHWL